MPGIDKHELKEQLVWQFTNCRTESLKEMRYAEYNNMCNHMQQVVNKEEAKKPKAPLTIEQLEMKRARSAVLLRLQKLGVNTTDFAHVDNFCLNTKIAGKVFRKITLDELKSLVPKLESILRKNNDKKVEYIPTERLN